MTGYKSKYPLDQQAFVRDAWDAGVSASMISQRMNHTFGLNTTRNAVISLTKRLGCPLRESNGPWQLEGRARRDATIAATHGPRPKRAASEPPMPSEAPLAIGPIDDHVDHGCCKWPVNHDGQAFQQCGQPAVDRKSYCGFHAGRARGTQQKPMIGTSRSDRVFR